MSENYRWNFSCPKGWEIIGRWGDGFAVREKDGKLRVLVDCEFKSDGNPWLHVSYSKKYWVPSHEDTCKVKQAFFGNRYAYAVFPPAENYVNIHPNCLHLWGLMNTENGQVLPEFSEIVNLIGRSI
jgi:hypothetical protein